MDSEWDGRAAWIWHPNYDDTRNPGSIVLFRKEFHIESLPSRFEVNVTADSRYRLFLNGKSISVGPCKGVPAQWYYETVDALPSLCQGHNVLAAQVLRFSPAHRGNTSVSRSSKPGFVLLAAGDNFALSTDLSWKCIEDTSTAFDGQSMYDLFMANTETVDGPARHFGWTDSVFDDKLWLTPREICNETPGIEPREMPWSLAPRCIPPLTEIPKTFQGVVAIRKAASGVSETQMISSWTALLRECQELQIPANEDVIVDINASEYSSGYLRIVFQNGARATVKILCAESYEESPRDNAMGGSRKSSRLDYVHGYLNGAWDTYTVAGRQLEPYEPFWFRTFRFIRIHVKARTEPLTVKEFSYRETTYPLEVKAVFKAIKEPMFSTFWDISVRTLKNCMHETYEDCPYYEQTQFVFDTRIQMLLTYIVSGDDRLARKSLQDFRASMRPDGLISMRSPGHTNIVLPVFSLFFPLMIWDHILYFGDKSLAKYHLPSIDAILNFYGGRLDNENLVSRFGTRWWSFIDWVDDWNFGAPPAAQAGPATYFSLVYALALGVSARVAEFVGRFDAATEYLTRKGAVIKGINQNCFDGKWYYDGPISDKQSTPAGWLSQHCQVYAVLAGAIEGDAARDLMNRTLDDKSLNQMTLSQAFYLFRALEATDLYDRVTEIWSPWVAMIEQGLDTWAETLHNPRSDCHAWSAAPLYEVTAMIVGIQPLTPGFDTARIRPRPELLKEVDCAIVAGKSLLRVSWHFQEGTDTRPAKLHLSAQAPEGVSVLLDVHGATRSKAIEFTGKWDGEIELVDKGS